MELRHLRFFIAVAEEGSVTNAAERRLHTAQPSVSRQIRDLELEVGVKCPDGRLYGSYPETALWETTLTEISSQPY
jgi:LysR family hca operon transcriptional activator